MQQPIVQFNYEYEQKIKVCFIGAGQHAYRNIYPTFQYAPVELKAVCDIDANKAAAFAKQFGAERSYTNHQEMLEVEKPDAVFIVTSYHPDGRVQATDLALDALRAGVHVWMEKPTAATTEEVWQLIEAREQSGKHIMTGLKKMFNPVTEKVKEIISRPEFGVPSSIYLTYPQPMAELNMRQDLNHSRGLLDHVYHPLAIVQYLMGKIERMSYEWEGNYGGSVTSFKFLSGAVGTLHMPGRLSGSSPEERLEIVGDQANVVADNAIKLTYYRKAERPAYGRSASFIVSDEQAPLHWEPEFSLGNLYNKNLFLLGYVQEVLHFCTSIIADKPPTKGTLEDSLEIMKVFEAYCHEQDGQPIRINTKERD